MKKVAFHSFGCRTNQEETSGFAASFRELGYETVKKLEDADIIVVNSCSVTAEAEGKVKKFIKSLSKKYPNTEINVTGCMAQQLPEKVNSYDNVKLVVGNSRKKELPKLVSLGATGIESEEITKESGVSTPDLIEAPEISRKTRFSLKIQEGCNHFCSFCIVPYLRGPSRNLPMDEVLKTAKKAIDLGYREIVLTGTHIGQFRDGDTNFLELIKKIINLGSSFRVRLSSMNPSDCSSELFEYMLKEPRICRHLHISLQSLSPKILKLMKRSSRSVELLEPIIKKYRKLMPDLNIGADIIVGFPGETNDLFEDTSSRLSNYYLTYGHIFKYSPRPGTKADEMEDSISSKEKSRRSLILRNILKDAKIDFIRLLNGQKLEIIAETNGVLKGVSGNYLRVVGNKNSNTIKNELYKVRVSGYNLETSEIKIEELF
jgi:threonylcarbamoyladenosine tRNA methylthiotransferase MtaB